jgi:DNA-binding response OmpR family regulator
VSMQQDVRLRAGETKLPVILLVALPSVGRDLALRLGSDRFEIHRTPDLESASETIRRLRPDLAVVALDSPDLTTETIVDPLRAHVAGLPVIVLSSPNPGMDDPDVIELDLDAPDDVLDKAVFTLLGAAR